ncbi:MAG TPA: NUDIX domain-containing protein [Micromonospora sp.]
MTADPAGSADPHRRAVRVVCRDPAGRVFLLCWRDPADAAHVVWEPPGGGIEPGETEERAAVREVLEETGMAVVPVPGRRVIVHRDLWWGGRHYAGPEPFLLAEADPAAPLAPTTLNAMEHEALLDARWFTPDELRAASHPLEPPDLADLIAALDRPSPAAAAATAPTAPTAPAGTPAAAPGPAAGTGRAPGVPADGSPPAAP